MIESDVSTCLSKNPRMRKKLQGASKSSDSNSKEESKEKSSSIAVKIVCEESGINDTISPLIALMGRIDRIALRDLFANNIFNVPIAILLLELF